MMMTVVPEGWGVDGGVEMGGGEEEVEDVGVGGEEGRYVKYQFCWE